MTRQMKMRRDGAVIVDDEVIGWTMGEPRDWGFILATYRRTDIRMTGYFTRRDAAEACVRAAQGNDQ